MDVHLFDGSVTSPRGYLAGGVASGVKRSGRPDLALIGSRGAACAAGVFTTNRVRAAPVEIGIERLRENAEAVRGILCVSGVANAMTGSDGRQDNLELLSAAEAAAALPEGSLLPACTGVIGPRLPVARIRPALGPLIHGLSSDRLAAGRAAGAILTTDSRAKECAASVRLSDGTRIRVGGMAKGSGMIAPRLAPAHATTLAFLTTDARASPEALGRELVQGAESTFNQVSVDGDTSTNDTIYLLANGAAGGARADHDPAFGRAVRAVLESLARQVAADGEGATKLLTVTVRGARSLREARVAARAVVGSTLVKAALFGADPNVGRIACALGYSGARLDPERIDVALTRRRGTVPLIVDGRPAPGLDNGGARRVRDVLRSLDEVPLEIDLHEGRASARAWGCDLSYAYVQINAAYRT